MLPLGMAGHLIITEVNVFYCEMVIGLGRVTENVTDCLDSL